MPKIITADEVKRHKTSRSVWMVIRNNVYDVTAFLEEHPGGTEPLLEAAGQDATIAFDDVGHSADAVNMLAKYKIGTLAPGQGCSKYHRECINCDPSSQVTGEPVIYEKPRLTCGSRSVSQKSSVTSGYKSPVTPVIERRVRNIVVPHDPSSKLKWALLALGLAVIIGIAYKRYAS